MLKVFKYPKYVFLVLVVGFLIYSLTIYFAPQKNNASIASGKDLWQQNNCHTCHQLYGLGGYLGPDLTNVVNKEGYSNEYIKSIIQQGRFQMPAFKLSEKELDELILFLHAANESGSADPADYTSSEWGTFNRKSE